MYALVRKEHIEIEGYTEASKELIAVSSDRWSIVELIQEANGIIEHFTSLKKAKEQGVWKEALHGVWRYDNAHYQVDREREQAEEEFADALAKFENRPRGETDFRMWADGYRIEYILETVPEI